MNRWLGILIAIVIVLAIAVGVTKFMTGLLNPQSEPSPVATATATAIPSETTAAMPAPATTTAVLPKPESTGIRSRLPLRYLAAIVAPKAKYSVAVLESTDGKKRMVVKAKDRIDKQTTVKSIAPERILLLHNRELEFIPVELGVHTAVTKAPALDEFNEQDFEMKGDEIATDRTYVRGLLREHFADVLQGAKAEPMQVGGKTHGFQVTEIRDNSIYRKLGLQEGDIVEAINGEVLNEPEQIIDLARSLRKAPVIIFEINRDGTILRKQLKIVY